MRYGINSPRWSRSANEARESLSRTIAPDTPDLFGDYASPSIRRLQQNAQPKAVNYVLRQEP